jgi:hypothetical protein
LTKSQIRRTLGVGGKSPVRFAALVLLAPIAAVAQTSPDGPSSASAAAGWSLGAGIALFTVATPVRLDDTAFFSRVTTPQLTASLERRLASGTWLVLGASGAIRRDRTKLPLTGEVQYDERVIDVSVGIRQVLTRRGTPVDLSVVALADAGGGKTAQRMLGDAGTAISSGSGSLLMLGGSVGLALDRELIDALSVRVATPLVSATWARARNDFGGGVGKATATTLTAGLMLAPRLELRVAF